MISSGTNGLHFSAESKEVQKCITKRSVRAEAPYFHSCFEKKLTTGEKQNETKKKNEPWRHQIISDV